MFEGRILSRSNGLIALDNINVQYQSCREAPHFLRLGDTEVNEGQSAELQCIANGDASWGQNIRLQKFSSGMEEKIFRSHNMVNFQSAKFIWPAIGTADADKIRYNFLKLLFNREIRLLLTQEPSYNMISGVLRRTKLLLECQTTPSSKFGVLQFRFELLKLIPPGLLT